MSKKPENNNAAKAAAPVPSPTKNQIDGDFERLVIYLKERTVSAARKDILQNLNYFKSKNPQLYQNTINYYNEHKLWGTYAPENGDYALADNRAEALVEHLPDFEWLYAQLADYRSKRILVNILYFWLMSDPTYVKNICDNYFEQYLDLDLVSCTKDEVFVDVGAYTGDSLASYTRVFGKDGYKQFYCYEIVPANIAYIEENIRRMQLQNVVVKKKGAASSNGTMFLAADEVSSIAKLSDNGGISVPIVKIDDDIDEAVSYIKMDIEGAEEDALLGCIETIKRSHPKLALCVYHNHKDMWKLARIVHEADPSYRFHLRYYGGPILPTEYVLYAI
jgi:FkbM family methyltransferase